MDTNDIYKKVIESAQNIKYIREDVTELKKDMKEETRILKEEMKEEKEACHKRISRIQDVQNLNVGKLSVILVTIGAVILGAVQLVLWFMSKFIK